MENSKIKSTISNFVNFDIENNYYQKEDKEELVRQFKQIIYEDEITVRKFLKAMFNEAKKLAFEYSLIESDDEVDEINYSDEDEENKKSSTDEEDENLQVPESFSNYYIKKAADMLYE